MPVYGKEPIIDALRSVMEARVPAMIVGQPGVGKSAVVREIAKDMGYETLVIIGSRMDPTDLVGLPAKGDKNNTVFLEPWWQTEILEKKKIVLFLDEFSTASVSIQKSLLTFLQDREFADGTPFPEETIVLGAMNPLKSAVGGSDLALPVSNRLIFLPWQLSHNSWFEGMLDNWGEKGAPESLSEWRRKIVAFIKENPSLLHKEPENYANLNAYGIDEDKQPASAEIARLAWASMRSWDNLAKVLANSPKDTYVQDMIIRGTVGVECGEKFRMWLHKNSVYMLEDVISNPKTVKWDELDFNEGIAIFRGLEDTVNSENATKVLSVVNEALKQGKPEFVAPFYKGIFGAVTSRSVVGETMAKKLVPVVAKMNKKISQSFEEN